MQKLTQIIMVTTGRMKDNPDTRRKLGVVREHGEKEGELNSVFQGKGQEILSSVG